MNDLMKPFDIFDDLGRPLSSLFSGGLPSRLLEQSDSWMPPVDIRQMDNEYQIDVEVPGFTPDQIEVEAHDNVLTIQGERKEEKESSEGTSIRKERRYGRFLRRFTLPQGADAEHIEAKVKDGVLVIHIPHQTERPAKKIEVS
jgi:HSP20 family protein